MSESKYANLTLAEAIGRDAPEREHVEQSEAEGILGEFLARAPFPWRISNAPFKRNNCWQFDGSRFASFQGEL